MKKNLFFVALAAFALVACDKDGETLAAPEGTVELPNEQIAWDGMQTSVLINANCDWSIRCDSKFATFSPAEGNAETKQVKVTIAPNTTNEALNIPFSVILKGANGESKEIHESILVPEPSLTYGGDTYKVVYLNDGKFWMAEPLAYLPQGVEASDAPSANSKDIVFYPYSSDGTTCTALKDAASIKAKGYLYKALAVFGDSINENNYGEFEGAQGICPDGWHIPTRAEYIALLGYSNKSTYAQETAAIVDTTACYYDKNYNGSSVRILNEAGFNFVLSGTIANNIYQKMILSDSNCSVQSYLGNPSLTYVWTSSPHTATQFFAAMTTFNKTTYPEGRVTLAYADVNKGANQVRCVRDAK